jgi:RNA polymerase sigma factor (sigma-70 family)
MTTKRPFEQIVTQHGPTVLRVCRALLARTDADDAWSETFLAALRAYPELPAEANVQAWLVTIAHRKAIDALRAQARRPQPVPEPPEPAPVPAASGDRDDEPLWSGWRALTDRQREVVALHHVAGLPYAEVAERVGGTAAAARRAAADGIAALRRHYPELNRLEEPTP